jgi:CMP-N-acetylneuraminic acid synthetase
MPRDRSIDIDTPLDWLIAETLLLRRLNTGTHPDTRIVT